MLSRASYCGIAFGVLAGHGDGVDAAAHQHPLTFDVGAMKVE